MCGIVGYIGPGACREILLAGLARLEYRGYDSAGIALLNGDLKVSKCAGRVRDLEARSIDLPATAAAGIGHTRWATHGGPSDANAHPHVGPAGRIALVHNGIIARGKRADLSQSDRLRSTGAAH
jgi:glucosamine--fructose-6-phosphate aminotransferase (isomerizing)